MKTFKCLAVAVAAVVVSTAALADGPKKCELIAVNSTKVNYEQVGTEACAALCKSTDGCAGWNYQPHNFNPKNAPGACWLLPDVSEEKESSNKFCGRME